MATVTGGRVEIENLLDWFIRQTVFFRMKRFAMGAQRKCQLTIVVVFEAASTSAVNWISSKRRLWRNSRSQTGRITLYSRFK